MKRENFAEKYNQTVDSIISDETKTDLFLSLLDEQTAVLIVDGGMSEEEAEKVIRQPENLRRTALYFL